MRFISSTLFSIAAAMASFGLLFAVPPGARAAARQASSSLSAAPPPAPLSTSAELAAASERVAKMEHTLADWPDLAKYRDANAALAAPSGSEKRVVFMGDSITESWGSADPQFFAAHAYIDRGISGQTTPQMLVRFRQDVIALRPAVVVILAGTNDIAGNTGPT
ncbi:MAG: GDSL-type esterase/lipase family protein, partial [Candidatus Acidiferrales bacterium]